jgi:hypothetical protein
MKWPLTVLHPEGIGSIAEDFRRAKQALYNATEPNEIVLVLHTKFGISIRMIKVATKVPYRVSKRWITHNASPGNDEAEVLQNFKAIVLFLAESGMFYIEEISRLLNSRQAEISFRRPITFLQDANLDQVISLSAKLVSRMRGFGDGEEIAL